MFRLILCCLREPALPCSAPGPRSCTAAAHREPSPAPRGLGPCCCSWFLFSRCAHAHRLQMAQTLAVVCSAVLLRCVQLCTHAIRCCPKLIHCKCQSPVPVSRSAAGVADYWAGWLAPTGRIHQLLACHGFHAWLHQLAAAAAASCAPCAVPDVLCQVLVPALCRKAAVPTPSSASVFTAGLIRAFLLRTVPQPVPSAL